MFDKSALYDKYNRHKNNIFVKKDPAGLFTNREQPEESRSKPSTNSFFSSAILGASPERIRSYGGRQLSQSDFERSILGVSTATEISVKSVICVKGQCFNADDAKLKSK